MTEQVRVPPVCLVTKCALTSPRAFPSSQQKSAIYDGRAEEVVEEIERKLKQVKLSDTKTKRLQKIRNYLAKRIKKMNYKALREQDLEISSGAVEGAVNYVIAKRFDSGGMRWIKERAEALLGGHPVRLR